ncbi:MAG: endonuclease/exonuclease/phosphatase family protein [Gammaproteobacteria bacterium]|nr:endonuclease/exonuclease/phosphatase family protein [Gammaproteobacteria bacterium]
MTSVLTLNIWNYEGPWEQRLPLIRACIEALNPDLIALQEVLLGDAIDQPRLIFDDTPYHYDYAPAQDFWIDPTLSFGNLVASRWPLAETQAVELPQREGVASRIALTTQVQAPESPICFTSTHLTYPPYDGYWREQQVQAIAMLVRERRASGGHPAIVCGDFNAIPESAEIRHMAGRQSINESSTFFIDAFEAAGNGDGATMVAANPFAANTHVDMRLDYIFVGLPSEGRGRIKHCRVVANDDVEGVYPSDHFGVYAELT